MDNITRAILMSKLNRQQYPAGAMSAVTGLPVPTDEQKVGEFIARSKMVGKYLADNATGNRSDRLPNENEGEYLGRLQYEIENPSLMYPEPQPLMAEIDPSGKGIGKKPWEMTKSGFTEKQITKALKEGKPVPEEVLKDYPELPKKIKTGFDKFKKETGKDLIEIDPLTDEFDTGMKLMKAQGKEALAEYRKAYPKGTIVLSSEDGKRGVLIHKSMRNKGEYQRTTWDEQGFFGDTQHKTEVEAVQESITDHLNVMDPEGFTKLTKTKKWKEGIAKAEEVQKWNKEQFLKAQAPKAADLPKTSTPEIDPSGKGAQVVHKLKKVTNLKGKKITAPREFFRGTDNNGKRVVVNRDDWDKNLFAADNIETASWYGKDIEFIAAKPEAKILYEGTKEFRTTAKGLWGANKRSDLDASIETIKRAEREGYDAVWFKRQGDIGTVIIKQDAFVRSKVNPNKVIKTQ